jgi:diguanylate cyclase (GGDEF)-like protein
MLIDNEYQVVTDTSESETTRQPFPYVSVMHYAEDNDKAYSVFKLNGSLYEFVIVPIKAPITIAWIGVGFKIDEHLLAGLQSRSPLPVDISVLEHNDHVEILATTLQNRNLGNELAVIKDMPPEAPTVYAPGDGSEEFMALSIPLKTDIQAMDNLQVLLQYSLKEAFRPYRSLLLFMATITVLGLGVSILAGILLARTLTRPVSQLANAAKLIEQGNYDCDLQIKSRDEIGGLQNAFKTMQSAISVREKEIKHLAYHDQLTELPNRLMFENTLQELIRQAAPARTRFSIVMIGVQSLREIVNVLGHDIGDQLIKLAGQRLVTEIEEIEVLARISSDSFAILLMNCDENNLQDISEKIARVFSEPMEIAGNNIDVFVSMGAACFPLHSENGKLLIQHADAALLKAMQSGDKIVVYDHTQDQHKNNLSLMGELRSGITSNELSLYYQPKVNLASSRISHVEALVRWQHPQRGFMSPDDFIPLAENTGNIHSLTRWVLEKAVLQSSRWAENNINLGIAVNISANDLLRGNLKKIMAGLVSEYQIDPSLIVFEITESALMENPDEAVKVLEDLKSLGLQLSIDDYGTGYSSMEYLKRLPVDELKIDKSFVLDISNNKTDQIIVRSAIELGHDLGLKIIAEGVEDQIALEFLKSKQCDIGQGYLFSKPLPIDELDVWMKQSPWGISQSASEKQSV